MKLCRGSAGPPRLGPISAFPVQPKKPDWPALASAAALAAGIVAAYAQTFAVPLLLDDDSSIRSNSSIRQLWPLGRALAPPDSAGVGGRPLLNLSFALNYRIGGTEVFSYHAVNLAIHVLAAWVLFALVRRTLRLPVLAERFGAASTGLALAVSALWALHPVLTESVTYLSQRAESLMGLFYLLTLYCFVRQWNWLCVLSCLGGVGTKEVIATAPIMVLLYDRTFVSGTFAAAWKRHRILFVALAATWIPLGWLMIGLGQRNVGFGQGTAWWSYGLTECRAICRYLLLAVWPRPLIFDYGTDQAVGPIVRFGSVALLAALLTAVAKLSLRRPMAGFTLAWVFLILAPTSSIIPIAGQPIAENRLYLPLAGLVAAAAVGLFAWIGRASWAVFAVAAAMLGLATAVRNQAYRSVVALWSDTVAKNPGNSRAHTNLGTAWLDTGRLDEAVAQYEVALRLKPGSAEAHNNLGSAWEKIPGRLNAAVSEFEAAIRLKPDFYGAHYNLGTALERISGRERDAVAQLQAALRLKPDFAEAHYNLGTALERIPGRSAEAVAEYQEAIRLYPEYAAAHENLGNALIARGMAGPAAAELETAVRLLPDSEEAHYNLANVLKKIPGRLDEAIEQYRLALALQPDHAEAHNNFGNALSAAGRLPEAIVQYQEAVRLRPDFTGAKLNLAAALSRSAQTQSRP